MASGLIQNLFAQTTNQTVANTVTETTLIDGGVGTLALPANFFKVGKSIRFELLGYHSSTANPNITIKVKLGSTVVLTTGAVTSGNGTNDLIQLSGLITCRAVGDIATGLIVGHGKYQELGTGQSTHQMVNLNAISLDTEVSHVFDITAEWGTADPANSITSTNVLIEVIS